MATAGTSASRGAAGRPEPARLARGVLTNFDISAATLANIAPAMSFSQTPWVAFLVFLGLALGLVYVFCRSSNPDGVVVFFGEIATLGTILVALTYLIANLALPMYFRRLHPERLSPLTHVILPLLGAAAIGYPLYELVKPGQPAPFNSYRWIALGILVAALVWGAFVYRRDPAIGERVGSIVADAE